MANNSSDEQYNNNSNNNTSKQQEPPHRHTVERTRDAAGTGTAAATSTTPTTTAAAAASAAAAAASTAVSLSSAASGVRRSCSDKNMPIFLLNEEIVRDHVCSFLDRPSICNLLQEETISNHFQLHKYFCDGHGTRLLSLLVSEQERNDFQLRKEARRTEHTNLTRNNNLIRSHPADFICIHPSCMDCVMALDLKLWCGECNEFTHTRRGCSSCWVKEICLECLPLVRCRGCYESYCRDCFHGFLCCYCNSDYCHDCDQQVLCENHETCANVACSDCASCYLSVNTCDECYGTRCQDCVPCQRCEGCERRGCQDCGLFVECARCDDKFCVDCKDDDGTAVDGSYYCSRHSRLDATGN